MVIWWLVFPPVTRKTRVQFPAAEFVHAVLGAVWRVQRVVLLHLAFAPCILRWCGSFVLCLSLVAIPLVLVDGPVAQWIRHRPAEPGIAGSSPAGVIVACWRGFYLRVVEQLVGSLSSVVRAMVL